MLDIRILAVGRMGQGPHVELASDYIARLSGLPLKWQVSILEIDDRKALGHQSRKRWDAGQILPKIPDGAAAVALDERGKSLTSPAFADMLSKIEQAQGLVCFAIGGPDGLDETVRQRCDRSISFGAMTWPHKLVRAMLAEQIYRAASITTNHPYHRA